MGKSLKVKSLFMASLAAVSLCSCGKSPDTLDAFGEIAESMAGEYSVTSMFWHGVETDFNNDGFGERDLLSELSGTPGFVPSWISAMVGLSDKLKSSLCFSMRLPVTLVFLDGHGTPCPMVEYVEVRDTERYFENHSSADKFKRADLTPETWEDCASQDSSLRITGDGTFEFHTDVRLWDPSVGAYKVDKVTYSFKRME